MRNTPQRTEEAPTISWCSGRMIETERNGKIHYEGFFVDVDRDAALDAAAAAAGWRAALFRHMGGRTSTHWLLPQPTVLIPISTGTTHTTIAPLVRNAQATAQRTALAVRWPDGERSRLSMQVIVADLLDHDYDEPVVLTVSSTFTDDLLAALVRHNAVLTVFEQRFDAANKPRALEFWDVALVLSAGPTTTRTSKRGDGLSSDAAPIRCAHPADDANIDGRYFRAYATAADVSARIEKRYPGACTWASDLVARAGGGTPDPGDVR